MQQQQQAACQHHCRTAAPAASTHLGQLGGLAGRQLAQEEGLRGKSDGGVAASGERPRKEHSRLGAQDSVQRLASHPLGVVHVDVAAAAAGRQQRQRGE